MGLESKQTAIRPGCCASGRGPQQPAQKKITNTVHAALAFLSGGVEAGLGTLRGPKGRGCGLTYLPTYPTY